MRHIRKKIKINEKLTGEFTVEEIIDIYKNYIKKSAVNYYNYLQRHIGHANHIDIEDLEQIARYEIVKCYDKYDINYRSKGFENSEDKMGFYPIMDRNVQGTLLRLCRDTLGKRRKDYNIHEISLDYFDAPIQNGSGEKEMYLSEIIPSEEDCFENIDNKLEIEYFMSSLTDMERNIVNDLFLNNMTQVNVGLKYNISQVQVSRIQAKAIKKMRAIATSETKRNIKTERNVDMRKQSLKTNSFKELNEFLTKNVDNYVTLHHAITDYARINSLNKKDIYSMLENRAGAYSVIKEIYKDKLVDEVKETFEEKVIEKPIEKEPQIIIAEKATFPIEKREVPASNVFGSLDVESFYMVVNLDNAKLEVTNKGIKLMNIPKGYLNIEELEKLKENIDKAIEISRTFCK